MMYFNGRRPVMMWQGAPLPEDDLYCGWAVETMIELLPLRSSVFYRGLGGKWKCPGWAIRALCVTRQLKLARGAAHAGVTRQRPRTKRATGYDGTSYHSLEIPYLCPHSWGHQPEHIPCLHLDTPTPVRHEGPRRLRGRA